MNKSTNASQEKLWINAYPAVSTRIAGDRERVNYNFTKVLYRFRITEDVHFPEINPRYFLLLKNNFIIQLQNTNTIIN